MYDALVPQVLAKFGLAYTAIGERQKGYRNESYPVAVSSRLTVNLIFHKREPQMLGRIRAADLASNILAKTGLPVRTRFDKRTLKLADKEREIYAGVYTYLPGMTIPWEAYTKDHIKLLGWAMSDMHAAWAATSANVPHVVDELSAQLKRMVRYFEDEQVGAAISEKLQVRVDSTRCATLAAVLGNCRNLEGEHLLHMDMVRGNVLFSDEPAGNLWHVDDLALTGVIDFEKVVYGHPVFDIARTLAFLFVDCSSKSPEKIFKYFLESGYNKRGETEFSLTGEIGNGVAFNILGALIGFFLLHDFYKFLRHTPYESLADNYHYLRTRDILIDYGMICLSKEENHGGTHGELEAEADFPERSHDAQRKAKSQR